MNPERENTIFDDFTIIAKQDKGYKNQQENKVTTWQHVKDLTKYYACDEILGKAEIKRSSAFHNQLQMLSK